MSLSLLYIHVKRPRKYFQSLETNDYREKNSHRLAVLLDEPSSADFQNVIIDEIYLRFSVCFMYRVRRNNPQEISVVSGRRCEIFFLINNVINKHITPNIF